MSPDFVNVDRGEADVVAPTDEDLVLRMQKGDANALERLIRRYEVELFGYLKRYLGDSALAEDVFQAAFFQVYQKRDLFDGQRRFRPWLYAIATHQAIDALRRNKRLTRLSLETTATLVNGAEQATIAESLESELPGPDAVAMIEEKRRQVRKAVDELPDHLKPVVIMAYFEGMQYKEIADVLDIPVGTVKSRLFAAVRQLHERWNG